MVVIMQVVQVAILAQQCGVETYSTAQCLQTIRQVAGDIELTTALLPVATPCHKVDEGSKKEKSIELEKHRYYT